MRAVRIHTNDGTFSAVLGEPGRKYTQFVCLDKFPVRKRKMGNAEAERFSTPLTLGKKDYPLKRAVNNMLRVGRQHGITKGAKQLLMEAKAA